jgi:hypothetical protein
VLVGVGTGVAIPLLLFRRFTPNEVFPVTYRRGRSAHLDIGGARGQAIPRGLEDQLGLAVTEVKPFGLAGSAGSTPLRITVKGDPPRQLFGKLYAQSHLRADRWYKLGRELLYGRLEDEKPFNTVRRLVQQEDYAPSWASCSAPRAATCTPSSSGCCPPRRSRSRSSAGAPILSPGRLDRGDLRTARRTPLPAHRPHHRGVLGHPRLRVPGGLRHPAAHRSGCKWTAADH